MGTKVNRTGLLLGGCGIRPTPGSRHSNRLMRALMTAAFDGSLDLYDCWQRFHGTEHMRARSLRTKPPASKGASSALTDDLPAALCGPSPTVPVKIDIQERNSSIRIDLVLLKSNEDENAAYPAGTRLRHDFQLKILRASSNGLYATVRCARQRRRSVRR
jgi:hypothetical protein